MVSQLCGTQARTSESVTDSSKPQRSKVPVKRAASIVRDKAEAKAAMGKMKECEM